MANFVSGADNQAFSNISATTAAFTLRGGLYGITVTATFSGGNADGSTYVTAATAITAAGYSTAYLPPGTYKFAITTATAVYIDITSIPTG
jgi:hypothetical protein